MSAKRTAMGKIKRSPSASKQCIQRSRNAVISIKIAHHSAARTTGIQTTRMTLELAIRGFSFRQTLPEGGIKYL
jgi:hypothetical protein